MAGNRDWDMVRWVHRPPLDMYLSQLKQLGTRLLALDTTELKPPVPTRKVIEPQSLAARSSFIDRSKLVHSDIESSVPFTQLSAANPGTDPRTHSPENYSTPLQAEQPAPMDPEPPIVKRGTGILN
jgi:hypothetical protein